MLSRREFLKALSYDALVGRQKNNYSGSRIYMRLSEPKNIDLLGNIFLRYVALRDGILRQEDAAIGYDEGAQRSARCHRLVSETLAYATKEPILADGRNIIFPFGFFSAARGALSIGGHFIKPEIVVVGGDNWTYFRFDNVYCHETGHYAVFCRHGNDAERDTERWLDEGIARCVQEDCMKSLTEETGQANFLRSACDFVISDLATTYSCLSQISQTSVPAAVAAHLRPVATPHIYSMNPLDPEPHLLGTSFMKLLQETYGHDAYKRLFNNDFSNVDDFLRV